MIKPALSPCHGSCASCGNPDPDVPEMVATVPIQVFEGVQSEFISFSPFDDGRDHFAIRLGHPSPNRAPLVRIHSECVTGDVFGSARCDCGAQLAEAVQRISEDGGYLLYLRQEGRGIGLMKKLQAYELQDQGLDTYQANEALNLPRDGRDYTVAQQMLAALGIPEIRLLTNNPRKVDQLEEFGIKVTDRVAHAFPSNQHNERYLAIKAEKSGHLF